MDEDKDVLQARSMGASAKKKAKRKAKRKAHKEDEERQEEREEEEEKASLLFLPDVGEQGSATVPSTDWSVAGLTSAHAGGPIEQAAISLALNGEAESSDGNDGIALIQGDEAKPATMQAVAQASAPHNEAAPKAPKQVTYRFRIIEEFSFYLSHNY